ncbi:MAG TPA: FAD binding domain-containing protein [Micromonosporaceae bacterium]
MTTRTSHPEATPIAGGTDVMVALNRDHVRPPALLDLSRVAGVASTRDEAGSICLGAGTTYTDLTDLHAATLPGFAMVARGVGSRQVRNRGTIGGSLGTASPAGDLHPMMLAAEADIEARSVRGRRWIPARQFYVESESGPTALLPDELIAGVRVPTPSGPQRFLRIGHRQGLVKSVCSVAVALDVRHKRVRVGVGAVGPRPCRGFAAEEFLATEITASAWDAGDPLHDDLVHDFTDLVASAVDARTDLRATARYRRHALTVLARRCLSGVWNDRREELSCTSA